MAETEQDLSPSTTVGNSSTASSPLICETPMISLKESNVLLNTEVIAMQPFIVDQVLILKQLLKSTFLLRLKD